METQTNTVTRILDVAQRLAQTRGYNGFSYADVAVEVGIRTASIHYHFPSKTDLGKDLLARYLAAFRGLFAQIDRETDDPREKLARYVRAIADSLLDGGRMCLGGMMAADIATLPPSLGDEVRSFVAANESWLAGVLTAGGDAGVFRLAGPPETEARLFFASIEGVLLVSRAFADPDRFTMLATRLLISLEVR